MTRRVRTLLTACVAGKEPEKFLFTRKNGQPVRDFRWTWRLLCVRCGLGRLTCRDCGAQNTEFGKCKACKSRKRFKYSGLIIHDFRRSSAKAGRAAGTSESVIMEMSGWRTLSMFERYGIVSNRDRVQAVQLLEADRAAQLKQAKRRRKAKAKPSGQATILAPMHQKRCRRSGSANEEGAVNVQYLCGF